MFVIKFVSLFSTLVFFLYLMYPKESFSSEKLLEASVSARAEYNDNIFLTTRPHDGITSMVIKPSLSGIIKESNWQVKLNSELRVNQYSDHNLDSNGQFFELTGQYGAERDTFSISIKHDLVSSLSAASTDFGISSQRIERKTQAVTPQYTRFLTERLVLMLSYSYSDTDYLDDKDTRFVASFTETGSAVLRYNLTEKNQLSMNFSAVDYTRKDNFGDIQLFNANVSFDHEFSEILSVDLAIGISRRNSTNLQEITSDFFGIPITVPREINIKTRSTTLNLGLRRLLEKGSIGTRISRNTTTNSFGGLDERDRFVINYGERLSSLWRYSVVASYENVTSANVATASTDREIIFLEARTFYSLTQNWNVSMSYRYSQRKFKNVSDVGDTPSSNRLQIGLNYNLPSLSTF